MIVLWKRFSVPEQTQLSTERLKVGRFPTKSPRLPEKRNEASAALAAYAGVMEERKRSITMPRRCTPYQTRARP